MEELKEILHDEVCAMWAVINEMQAEIKELKEDK